MDRPLTDEERKREKEAHKVMVKKVFDYCLSEEYENAMDARADFELSCVYPHGMGVDWSDKDLLHKGIPKAIAKANAIDLSDLENSDSFKDAFRKGFIACDIIGRSHMRLTDHMVFQEPLKCPELDRQFSFLVTFSEEEKMTTYFWTKILVYNTTAVDPTFQWDGDFITGGLGRKNCSDPEAKKRHSLMREGHIKYLKSVDLWKQMRQEIPDISPKTLQTFLKHEKADDEKYRLWVAALTESRETKKPPAI